MTETKPKTNGCLIAFLSVGGTLVALVVAMVGCVGLFATSYKDTIDESEGNVVIEDKSWVPEGYTAFNNKVAFKYSDSGSYSCDRNTRCIQLEVVSKEGCDSLYAEVSELDGNGNNVGYNNETTSGLRVGEKALLKLDTYNDNAETFRLSKMSCY